MPKNYYEKGISGSVQEKNGYLHFVASFKDPITQKRKQNGWLSVSLRGVRKPS